ncbi:MAG TPA: SurA N-terminal domain-containing protein [Burkholderiales bacterium]|nr:SurA N-terminal domain-containing protein [Burkholderiales bacterium]
MYDFIYKHKKWLQIALLVLIVPPFALFGIDYYFRDRGGRGALVQVGDIHVSDLEYSQALRQAQDRMREMMKDHPDPAMLNSPQLKESVLNDLIARKVALAHAYKSGMTVSTAELQKIIGAVQAFRDESGRFSQTRYRQLLQGQGLTPMAFENDIRMNVVLEQLRGVTAGSGFLPDSVVERLLKIGEQEREVSQVVFNPVDFRKQVKIAAADVEKYYEEHKAEFQIPERVRLEYVLLSPDVVEQAAKVSEDELKAHYQANIERYRTAEERRASHILIPAAAAASAEEKAKAKAQAEDLLKQIKSAPGKFAELAKQFSKDPGSAEKGGDLGFFARGLMVKPFDSAVFSLKVGELAGPVETQYGYHIIRLDAVKAPQSTPFETVRQQILDEIRKPKLGRAYAEAADSFNNLVYEQFDSLQPAADALKLTVQKSEWVSRAGGNPNPLFNNDKLLNAVFSDEVLKNKHNTSAIEVQPNMLLSARVIEHKPVATLPLEQVRSDVMQILTDKGAIELAEKEGRAALEKLQKGEAVSLSWSPAQPVSLQKRQGLHPEGAQAVFGADVTKLPVYAGVPAAQGRFVVYRITKVKDLTAIDPEHRKRLGKQLAELAGQEQYAAYLASLRQRTDVKVDRKRLEGDAGR